MSSSSSSSHRKRKNGGDSSSSSSSSSSPERSSKRKHEDNNDVPVAKKIFQKDNFIECVVGDNMVCSICSNVMNQPVATECKRIACFTCLSGSKFTTSGGGCSTCSSRMFSVATTLFPPHDKLLVAVQAAIADLRVECWNKKCSYTGAFGMNGERFLAHIRECKHEWHKCAHCDERFLGDSHVRDARERGHDKLPCASFTFCSHRCEVKDLNARERTMQPRGNNSGSSCLFIYLFLLLIMHDHFMWCMYV
jgi:hypothetical protein